MGKRAGRLTERQRRFADLYLKLGNAAEAAEQAGFKRSYAQGAKRQAAVQDYLRERLEAIRMANVADANEVLEFLSAVMRGELEGDRSDRSAASRMKAAEMLGKRLGVFSEAAAAASAPVVLVDDIPDQAAPCS